MGALPRNLLFRRARGAEEVTVQARVLREEVVTRDIWLPGFYCGAAGARVRACAVKRACGPFKRRHGLSIKKQQAR